MTAENSRYRPTDEKKYADNFDRIFGSDKERKARVERQKKEARKASGITIISDIEPFKSPIDGSMITTRSQRDAHFKQHNITDSRDYSSEFIAKRSRERDDRLLGNAGR